MILGDGMRRGKKENLRLTAKQQRPQELAYPAASETRKHDRASGTGGVRENRCQWVLSAKRLP